MGGIRVHCRLDLKKINFLFFPILDEVAQEMEEASKVSNTRWTLADLKTAVWLVENRHLTQLENPVLLAPDLDIASVSEELEIMRQVTLIKQQGQVFIYSLSWKISRKS